MPGQIGFIPGYPGKARREKAPHESLLRFDSGNSISFEDASHHLLVMGTTGSGKTASVVLPALCRLIEAGHRGVIIDVKGNLRGQVHAIAKRYGRSADLVEFGSSPSATPLNLLNGMDMSAVRNLLETLTMEHFQNATSNKDWHIKGVHQAADCVQLLRYLTALDAAFEPTINMVASMINDHMLSNGLFTLLKDTAFSKKNAEQRMFVERLQSNAFHIFNPKPEGKFGREYLEQITWNLQGIRMALTDFLEAPGIARGFASQGSSGVDVRGLLEQSKIVLLRFAPDTGPVGASLARMILREYYKAVYATGLTMPEGTYSFACLDEFQDFAELNSGRFSDTNFIAQAREFRAIFLASTQSIAALANRGNSRSAVDAFVSNCNARVLFYSDDPLTQNMAAQYNLDMQLNSLRSGEAFVVQYDTVQRNHSFGVETLQQAYKATRDILRQVEPTGGEGETIAQEIAWPTVFLFELLERHAKIEQTATEEKLNDVVQTLVGGLAESLNSKKDSAAANIPVHARVLLERFPSYFVDDKPFLSFPAGWLHYAINAFRAFSESGLPLKISTVVPRGDALAVVAETQYAVGERTMNALLAATSRLCIFCGGVSTNGMLSACSDCLAAYGILVSQQTGARVEANSPDAPESKKEPKPA